MDAYTYTHAFAYARGCTNQFLILLNTVVKLEQTCSRPSVVFVDKFFAKFDDASLRIPWSHVLDIASINAHLRHVFLVDPWHLPDNTTFSWGTSFDNQVALPLSILPHMIHEQIDVSTALGSRYKDPAPMIVKPFILRVADKVCTFDEHVGRIHTSPLAPPTHPLDVHQDPIIKQQVLRHVRLCDTSRLYQPLHTQLNHAQAPVSVVHLRSERSDAIAWWSRQNGMVMPVFEDLLTKKYVHMITSHIPSHHILLILTAETKDNPVLDHLTSIGYTCVYKDGMCDQREVMAIHDLGLATMYANGVVVCAGGASTFSQWLMIRLRDQVQRIVTFDMNNIHAPEQIMEVGPQRT